MFVALLAFYGVDPAAYAASGVLGTAEHYAVLGATAVTSSGATSLFGDLGLAPGTAITGFPPGVLTSGTTHVNDASSLQAQSDASAAYNYLAGLSPSQILTGELGGLTLTPGVYSIPAAAGLTGTLILDGQGNVDSRFIFQIVGALTTAAASRVTVINSASSHNIFFQVGAATTLGAGTGFSGNIIALAALTFGAGASVHGSVISLNAAVTLDNNSIIIAAVNDAPTLTTVSTLTGATEDTAFTISYATLAAAANAADVEGDALSFRVEAVTTGTLTTGGVAVVAGTTLLGTGDSLVWTPAGNANGTLNAFTIKAWDGTTTSATAIQVQVTVAAVNDAPVAGADTLTRPDSTRVTKVLLATLLANDTDPENDSLSITAVGSALPAGSTVSISGAFVVYIVPSNAAGNGSFTYTLSDGSSSVTGTVTITETSSSAAAGSPNSASLVAVGSDYALKFLGVPGQTYGVQYTTDASTPYTWNEFPSPVSRVAPASGVMSYTDVAPTGPIRLYRAVLLP